MKPSQNTLLGTAAFWALGIIWGSNFIYMKWAVELISPMQIVLLRVAFGFVPVAIYAYLSKAFNRSHWRYLPHFFIMALLATTLYYIAFAKGTALLLSGVAGAVSGSIPLFAFILAIIFIKEETLSWRKVIGIILGFMGVLLIALPNQTDLASSNLTGVLSYFSMVVCHATAHRGGRCQCFNSNIAS